MIKVRSANPDIAGNSTSVNMRSRSVAFFFKVSHAFNPLETAITAWKKLLHIDYTIMEHNITKSFLLVSNKNFHHGSTKLKGTKMTQKDIAPKRRMEIIGFAVKEWTGYVVHNVYSVGPVL